MDGFPGLPAPRCRNIVGPAYQPRRPLPPQKPVPIGPPPPPPPPQPPTPPQQQQNQQFAHQHASHYGYGMGRPSYHVGQSGSQLGLPVNSGSRNDPSSSMWFPSGNEQTFAMYNHQAGLYESPRPPAGPRAWLSNWQVVSGAMAHGGQQQDAQAFNRNVSHSPASAGTNQVSTLVSTRQQGGVQIERYLPLHSMHVNGQHHQLSNIDLAWGTPACGNGGLNRNWEGPMDLSGASRHHGSLEFTHMSQTIGALKNGPVLSVTQDVEGGRDDQTAELLSGPGGPSRAESRGPMPMEVMPANHGSSQDKQTAALEQRISQAAPHATDALAKVIAEKTPTLKAPRKAVKAPRAKAIKVSSEPTTFTRKTTPQARRPTLAIALKDRPVRKASGVAVSRSPARTGKQAERLPESVAPASKETTAPQKSTTLMQTRTKVNTGTRLIADTAVAHPCKKIVSTEGQSWSAQIISLPKATLKIKVTFTRLSDEIILKAIEREVASSQRHAERDSCAQEEVIRGTKRKLSTGQSAHEERDAPTKMPKSTDSAKDAGGALLPVVKKAIDLADEMKYPRIQLHDRLHVVQVGRCLWSAFADFQKCRSCIAKTSNDICRFYNFRAFPVDIGLDGKLSFAPDASTAFVLHPFATNPETLMLPGHADLNRPMDNATRTQLMQTAASALLPTMEEALAHVQDPAILVRPDDPGVRAMCDFCSTGLFASSYVCRTCGKEYCVPCQRAMVEACQAGATSSKNELLQCYVQKSSSHDPSQLVALSRFSKSTIEKETQAMRAATAAIKGVDTMTSSHSRLKRGESQNGVEVRDSSADWRQRGSGSSGVSVPTHSVKTFDKEAMQEADFVETWRRGEPLVVNGAYTRTEWGPSELQKRYGEMDCTVVRCDKERKDQRRAKAVSTDEELPTEKIVKVHDFFATFGMSKRERRAALGEGIWKLKDWPPTDEFKNAFPDIYDDFNHAVPMPDFTRRDGCKNLSSLFPKNALRPDLGPKMYNAWPGEHGKGKMGTTKLHMDIADAVNILLYAAEDDAVLSEGHESAAQWDIFRAEDALLIREFLHDTFDTSEVEGDPIHSQKHYLDDVLLQKLYKSKGVHSWRILQRVGQAVFIPAGCAHQVCNLTDCIKVAVDFLSPQNVQRCFRLTEEFRGLSGAHRKSWKEDVLQLRAQLWYAWCACREMGAESIVELEAGQESINRERDTGKDGDTSMRVDMAPSLERDPLRAMLSSTRADQDMEAGAKADEDARTSRPYEGSASSAVSTTFSEAESPSGQSSTVASSVAMEAHKTQIVE